MVTTIADSNVWRHGLRRSRMGTKSTHHVTGWLQAAHGQDLEKRNEAQRRLHDRYFRHFCRIAASELGGNLSKRVDSEAVANDVFAAYFARPHEKVVNRRSLWRFPVHGRHAQSG